MVEMEDGPVLNLLGSNLRAPAEAALAVAQPSLCTYAARIRRPQRQLQGPQAGRIRATSGRR